MIGLGRSQVDGGGGRSGCVASWAHNVHISHSSHRCSHRTGLGFRRKARRGSCMGRLLKGCLWAQDPSSPGSFVRVLRHSHTVSSGSEYSCMVIPSVSKGETPTQSRVALHVRRLAGECFICKPVTSSASFRASGEEKQIWAVYGSQLPHTQWLCGLRQVTYLSWASSVLFVEQG